MNNISYNIYNNKLLFLVPISEAEIYLIIMELNRNATPGLDKITVKDLQELVNVIKQPLTIMINKWTLGN